MKSLRSEILDVLRKGDGAWLNVDCVLAMLTQKAGRYEVTETLCGLSRDRTVESLWMNHETHFRLNNI